jgi:hypothetical protein
MDAKKLAVLNGCLATGNRKEKLRICKQRNNLALLNVETIRV